MATTYSRAAKRAKLAKTRVCLFTTHHVIFYPLITKSTATDGGNNGTYNSNSNSNYNYNDEWEWGSGNKQEETVSLVMEHPADLATFLMAQPHIATTVDTSSDDEISTERRPKLFWAMGKLGQGDILYDLSKLVYVEDTTDFLYCYQSHQGTVDKCFTGGICFATREAHRAVLTHLYQAIIFYRLLEEDKDDYPAQNSGSGSGSGSGAPIPRPPILPDHVVQQINQLYTASSLSRGTNYTLMPATNPSQFQHQFMTNLQIASPALEYYVKDHQCYRQKWEIELSVYFYNQNETTQKEFQQAKELQAKIHNLVLEMVDFLMLSKTETFAPLEKMKQQWPRFREKKAAREQLLDEFKEKFAEKYPDQVDRDMHRAKQQIDQYVDMIDSTMAVLFDKANEGVQALYESYFQAKSDFDDATFDVSLACAALRSSQLEKVFSEAKFYRKEMVSEDAGWDNLERVDADWEDRKWEEYKGKCLQDVKLAQHELDVCHKAITEAHVAFTAAKTQHIHSRTASVNAKARYDYVVSFLLQK